MKDQCKSNVIRELSPNESASVNGGLSLLIVAEALAGRKSSGVSLPCDCFGSAG